MLQQILANAEPEKRRILKLLSDATSYLDSIKCLSLKNEKMDAEYPKIVKKLDAFIEEMEHRTAYLQEFANEWNDALQAMPKILRYSVYCRSKKESIDSDGLFRLILDVKSCTSKLKCELSGFIDESEAIQKLDVSVKTTRRNSIDAELCTPSNSVPISDFTSICGSNSRDSYEKDKSGDFKECVALDTVDLRTVCLRTHSKDGELIEKTVQDKLNELRALRVGRFGSLKCFCQTVDEIEKILLCLSGVGFDINKHEIRQLIVENMEPLRIAMEKSNETIEDTDIKSMRMKLRDISLSFLHVSRKVEPQNLKRCVFCGGLHRSVICGNYPDRSSRMLRLECSGVCLTCLSKSHSAADCYYPVCCGYCMGDHNSTLCMKQMKKRNR